MMSRISKKLKFEITLTENDFQRLLEDGKLLIKAYPMLNPKFEYWLSARETRGRAR